MPSTGTTLGVATSLRTGAPPVSSEERRRPRPWPSRGLPWVLTGATILPDEPTMPGSTWSPICSASSRPYTVSHMCVDMHRNGAPRSALTPTALRLNTAPCRSPWGRQSSSRSLGLDGSRTCRRAFMRRAHLSNMTFSVCDEMVVVWKHSDEMRGRSRSPSMVFGMGCALGSHENFLYIGLSARNACRPAPSPPSTPSCSAQRARSAQAPHRVSGFMPNSSTSTHD